MNDNGKVTNLNRVRKTRKRVEQKARADANSVKFGRSKSAKRLDETEARKAERDLDQHRRDE